MTLADQSPGVGVTPTQQLEQQLRRQLIDQLRDQKAAIRLSAVEKLGVLQSEGAVTALASLLRREREDDVRRATFLALDRIQTLSAQWELLGACKSDKRSSVRKAAAETLAHMKSKLLLQAYAELMANEADQDVRIAFTDGVSKLEGAVDILIQQLKREPDRGLRKYVLSRLGELGASSARDALVSSLRHEEFPDGRIAAASSICRLEGEGAEPLLADRLEHDSDASVREWLATQLGKCGEAAIKPLVRAMVEDAAPEVREAASGALDKFNASAEKREALLDALATSGKSRGELDTTRLAQTVGGQTSGARQDLADFLIKQAPGKDERLTAILAELIITCCGGNVDLAGTRINKLAGVDEKYQLLRIQVGGTLALDPVFAALSENLQNHFIKPIEELNDRTRLDWERTIRAAHQGFYARMVMSILAFIVGMSAVIASAVEFLFGNVSGERLWGTGVSFAAGLGVMLAVVYRGPLKDIRQSVNDLGAASAAFIGFIHRVLQISHTYSFFYLNSKITFDDASKAGTLISKALADMRLSLEPERAAAGAGAPAAAMPGAAPLAALAAPTAPDAPAAP